MRNDLFTEDVRAERRRLYERGKYRGAIIQIISSPAGLSVAFDDLMVYRMEDGRYAVDCDKWQHIWKTASEAATDFIVARETMKLGFDFEISE